MSSKRKETKLERGYIHITIKLQSGPNSWEVVVRAGKDRTGIDAVKWAQEAVARGSGEVLLTRFVYILLIFLFSFI